MDPGRRQQIHASIVRFADGERGAFQPLFDALWPVLLAFTSRALGGQVEAEDAAQQAMVKLFSRIADFDRGRDGVAWALGIAGFEVRTIRKQRSRRREAGPAGLANLPARGRGLEDQAIADELQAAALAIAGRLPERDQAALARDFKGEPPPKDERARKQRFRALARLRAAFRRAHG